MKTSLLTLIAALLFGLAFGNSNLHGQWSEDSSGMFETQEEYNQFMGSAKRAASGSPEMRALIPMINDIALGNQIGSTAKRFDTSGSELGLLADPRVRADIEMVDDQFEDLRNRHAEIQKRLGGRLREIDFSDSDNVISQIQGIRDEAQSELRAVLLPHQVKRLQQIKMQSLLRRRSLVEVLTRDPIKSELEITEGQSDELRAFEKEVETDLAREIAKLQEKARGRLLSKLEPEQKSKAEEMIGDAFEFSIPANKKNDKRKSKGAKQKRAKN
jgi:hypothetical protein